MNANVKEPEGAALVVTIPRESAMAVFTSESGIDPFLATVRKHIDAFQGDVSTVKGRKEIASMAYRVAQSKTALEEAGKAVAAEAKELPRKIDANRKRMRDTLDAWRDEVRAPLDAWEAAEEARVAKHAANIDTMNHAARAHGLPAAELRALLDAVTALPRGEVCEEFEAEYERARAAATEFLTGAIADRERQDAEQAELLVLRQQAAERAAKDREAEIAREQAERVRLAAEQAAETERRAAAAEIARIEAMAADERAAAQRREDEAKAAVAAAEQRAQDAAAEAQRAIERTNAEHAAAIAAREADSKHKASVNRAAMSAFIAGGLSDEQAMWAVTLIAQKKIPAVSIAY